LENKSLKRLYLANIQATNYGLEHLACALRKNTTLTSLYLDLDMSNVSEEGIHKFRGVSQNLSIFLNTQESLREQIMRDVSTSCNVFFGKVKGFFQKTGVAIET
jgi:hypothetical protein